MFNFLMCLSLVLELVRMICGDEGLRSGYWIVWKVTLAKISILLNIRHQKHYHYPVHSCNANTSNRRTTLEFNGYIITENESYKYYLNKYYKYNCSFFYTAKEQKNLLMDPTRFQVAASQPALTRKTTDLPGDLSLSVYLSHCEKPMTPQSIPAT